MREIVDTRKCVRRLVNYDSPEAVVADAARLVAAGAATTGSWSLGEIIDHLATGIELVLDGFDHRAPWYVRLAGRVYFRRRILTRGFPAGLPFKAASARGAFREGIDPREALEHLRRATARLNAATTFAEHPVLGPLSRAEAHLLHRRHAELHMGFVCEAVEPASG